MKLEKEKSKTLKTMGIFTKMLHKKSRHQTRQMGHIKLFTDLRAISDKKT